MRYCCGVYTCDNAYSEVDVTLRCGEVGRRDSGQGSICHSARATGKTYVCKKLLMTRVEYEMSPKKHQWRWAK